MIASKGILAHLGLSDTVFGMTVLALAISVEEIARELRAPWRGRPDVSYGNVLGSVLAFFLCNAGIIALVRPVAVSPQVLRFYLPLCLASVALVSVFHGDQASVPLGRVGLEPPVRRLRRGRVPA